MSAYRAGPGLDEALDVCRRLAADGLASTIGYGAPPQASPRSVADAYLAAFARLASETFDCYASLKLSAIGYDASLLAELQAAAARAERRLHLDALAPETAELTWHLLEGLPGGARVSTTLPGRWRRSVDDAARAARRGLPVRIVKGQWPDSDAPVDRPAEGFLRIVDRLAGHTHGVAVATHDGRLLAEALRRLRESGTPCEAELFYGLPFRAPALCARRAGVPLRIYVPYGEAAGAPYRYADLVHNPAATWWLIQDLLLGKNKTWRGIRRSRTRP
ncbi:MAG TPA: hypothetical protein VF024_07275 [Solirubrobacteraceae bacterium]